ncbi:MAG: hypothetical protein AAB592_02365 [Patescibacteria group bacterium]
MNKKISSSLVFLAGIIILVIGALNTIAWFILYNFIQSTIKTPPPSFLIPFLNAFSNSLKHPLQIVVLIITLGLGVLLVVTAKKIKHTEKLFAWSTVSLVLGLVLLFELRGGGVFGGITAGILSGIGGIFGLIEATKKSE